MDKYTAYEVLKDILSCWDILDLHYFDFYKGVLKYRGGNI